LAALGRTRDELAASGLHVEVQLRRGEVAEQLVQAVGDHRADLVAMATHGRQGLARAILGSVASQVVVHGTTPVVLLRPGGKRVSQLRRLLVPVDGSPGGALGLAAAAGLARAAQARLILLIVAPRIPEYAYALASATPGSVSLDPSWEQDGLCAAQTYVDGLSDRLRRHGLEVEGRARLGEPATTIIDMARDVDADLVVMSTHARTGLARAVLGSVTDRVVSSADRPVMVIPHRVVPHGGGSAPGAPHNQASGHSSSSLGGAALQV
jgi:nucleotide-binding universal stress UspA family protein